MVNPTETWFFLSSLVLLEQTSRDMKDMYVDERHNYLLFGYALFYALVSHLTLLDIILLTIVAIIIGATMAKSRVLAKGDQQAIMGLLFGNYAAGMLVWFLVYLTAGITAAWWFGRKRHEKLPAFAILLTIQIATGVTAWVL